MLTKPLIFVKATDAFLLILISYPSYTVKSNLSVLLASKFTYRSCILKRGKIMVS